MKIGFYDDYRPCVLNAAGAVDVGTIVGAIAGFSPQAVLEKIINEFAMLRNQWLGIIKGLDIKQWQLSNIIKLRAAGLEDITL